MLLKSLLLSDTKPAKNVPQKLVVVDGAGDFAQVVEGQAYVLGQEVAGYAGIEAGTDSAEGLVRGFEGMQVAYVAHHGIVGRCLALIHFINQMFF
jgi:hypothetical protein